MYKIHQVLNGNLNKIIIFLLILGCVSCNYFDEEDLYGYYAPINYELTYDTIRLKPNNVYHRWVYNKYGNLVLETKGEWSLTQPTTIHFNDFFINFDRDITKYSISDTLGGWIGHIEMKEDRIQFCIGYFLFDGIDKYCYKKLSGLQ